MYGGIQLQMNKQKLGGFIFDFNRNIKSPKLLNEVGYPTKETIPPTTWSKVSLGDSHVVAITDTGAKLFSWGRNAQGAVGISKTNELYPDTENIKSFSAAYLNQHFIRNDGTLWGAGQNNHGMIGDGTSTARSSPVQIGTYGWKQIRTHYLHTLGIREDGRLYAWGNNGYGQLGDNTISGKTSPILVGDETDTWIDAAPGLQHSLAIKSNGTLWVWGDNTYNQLGDGSTAHRSSPVQIGAATDWVKVFPSYYHSFGMRSGGALYGWGYNAYGQLGHGDAVQKNSPVQVTGVWETIGDGVWHTIGIKSGGTLWGWGGEASWGEAGDGTVVRKSSPVQLGSDTWISVAAGYRTSFAIKDDYSLWSWGHNANGELGQNNRTHRSSPVQLGEGTSWDLIDTTGDFVMARRKDENLVYVWGTNTTGQIGLNDRTIHRSSPVQISSLKTETIVPAPILPTQSWTQASAGKDHTLAINSSSKLYGWGDKASGDGTFNYIGFTDVAAKANHTLAIAKDGTLWSWGQNNNGQLGNIGGSENVSSPVQISSLSWNKVYNGQVGDSYAIRSDGTLWGWGYDAAYAALGSTDYDTYYDTQYRSYVMQVSVGSGSTSVSWRSIASGTAFTLAVRSDGTMWSSGYNNYGQLGHGDTTNRSSPTQIGSNSDWVLVGAGSESSYAINQVPGSIAYLHAWGRNDYGQLGTNNITQYNVPTYTGFSSATGITKIQAGALYMMFLLGNGLLYSTGINGIGQLGNNSTVGRSAPVNIASSIVDFATGDSHAVAVNTSGVLYTWGNNNAGQLGLQNPTGSLAPSETPVPIASGTVGEFDSWVQVRAGNVTSGGVRSPSLHMAWGLNNYAQTGVGSATQHYSSPIVIGSGYSKVVPGGDHKLALTTGGIVYAWGYNGQGQLGNNSTITSSSAVSLSSGWTDIAANYYFSAGTKTSGLWAWGYNNYGQVGDNTTANKSTPVQIAGGVYTSVELGFAHGIAIKNDGSLWTWGYNVNGQLGDGTVVNKSSPIQIGTDSWTMIAGSVYGYYTMAIRQDGTLWTWGKNDNGQLGDGTRVHRSSPVQIGSDTDWTYISAGTNTAFGLKSDGSVYAWGSNSSYMLGRVGASPTSSPVQIPSSESFVQISGGSNHVFAITSNNQLYCWGTGASYGELGFAGTGGPLVTKSTPTQVGPSQHSWKSVGAGVGFTTAVRESDGTMWAWGNNSHGQLGQGNINIHRSSPVQVGSDTDWKSTSASYFTSYGIKKDGSLYAWGLGTSGQCANNSNLSRSSPVQVSEFTFGIKPWSYVYNTPLNTGSQVAGQSDDGAAFVWGYNSYGSFAQPPGVAKNYSSPIQISSSIRFDAFGNRKQFGTFTKLDTGSHFRAALTENNELVVWGDNSLGQIGKNDRIVAQFPTPVGNAEWSDFACGDQHVIAVKTNGTLWAWGRGTNGQLGQGNTIHRSSPVQIGADTDWYKVSSNQQHNLAIKTDGTLWAWGDGAQGQIGDGFAVDRNSPVQIGSNTDWTDIANGRLSSFAKNANNEWYAWGYNNVGQLVDGTTVNKSSPVQIASGLDNIIDKISSYDHTMLVANTSGILYGVGSNSLGQLGNLIATTQLTPIIIKEDTLLSHRNPLNTLNVPEQIGSLNYKSVEAGSTASYAINSNDRLYAWGVNTKGQLGHGDTNIRISPVQVDANSWNEVIAGSNFTIAKKN